VNYKRSHIILVRGMENRERIDVRVETHCTVVMSIHLVEDYHWINIGRTSYFVAIIEHCCSF
jgi:hypothetical protein